MSDAFEAALAALHASVLAVDAVYTPPAGAPVAIRVIRSQGSETAAVGRGEILLPTNEVQIRVADVPLPADDAALSIGAEQFILQGDPRLDAEGLTWTCAIEPA